MANERLVQLEKIFGIDVILTREKLQNLSQEDIITEYSDSDSDMNSFVEKSKQFLKDALYVEN